MFNGNNVPGSFINRLVYRPKTPTCSNPFMLAPATTAHRNKDGGKLTSQLLQHLILTCHVCHGVRDAG